ncbi:MAG: type IV secretion system DNA-binding domain-containing protein [Candidatus Pacebacteria bacterium]|nr:type IV secretion system DNA-binding domain-containing protein [Candidatus Paceibacterota bacterium]
MTPHTVLELRTSRDAKQTPEAMAQLFASLPELQNSLLDRLLKRSEHLSFEIIVQNQTVFFMCYCPTRLVEYLHGALTASYPQVLITQLNHDPLIEILKSAQDLHLENPSTSASSLSAPALSLGKLQLEQAQYLPLKTFTDFQDIDPLATPLTTLSKSQPLDQIAIQFVIADQGQNWKNYALKQISPSNHTTEASQPHPQKNLIEQKLAEPGVRTSIKLAVRAKTAQRSQLLLESLAAAFNSISKSNSNSLVLKKISWFKTDFINQMLSRSFKRNPRQHLSINELATLYHLPNEQLAVIPNLAWGKKLLGEPPANLPIVTQEMPADYKDEINVFAETTFKNQPVKYGLWRQDRRRHVYVIGKTGTGKSTLLANMAINDLKKDEGLCVVDPHGDLAETLLDYIPSHRINDVVYFNPADQQRTVQINLFEGKNLVHRELIASGIVSIFYKLYGYSWGPRLEYILRNALLTLLKHQRAKLSDVLNLLTNAKYRSKVIDKLDDPILKSFWVDEFNQMKDRQRMESIASILNKVGQFVSSPLVRNVVNATSSSFSIEDVMSQGKILIANLSQGRLGEDNATLLGAMLITKIQLAAMSRVNMPEAERRDFYLYVDEFQNFATQSFNTILSEARKYRLNLTLANQYIAQIPEEVQKAIFGNCGSIISFVMGAEDSAVFNREYGDKYTQEDLVSLGRYQIINKLSINNIISAPFPAHTLPLASSANQNREKVIRVSRERYARKKK